MFFFRFSPPSHLKLAYNQDVTLHHRRIILLVRLQAVIHMTASDTAIAVIDQLCHHLLQRRIHPGANKLEVLSVCLLMN